MGLLTNKVILIISPEKWNNLKLSKHNYADELAYRGNKVFFLNPPDSIAGSPKIREVINDNLVVIDYNTHVKGERFWPPKMLFPIRRFQAYKIENLIGRNVDIVWSFFPNQFADLNAFNAGLKIFHPVDRVTAKKFRTIAKNAGIVFSVAENILNDFRKFNCNAFFIDHGLAPVYAEKAYERLEELLSSSSSKTENKTKRVGYVGNLLRSDIDHETLMKIINENDQIEFIFWGPYRYEHLDWNHKGLDEVRSFVEFLQNKNNVVLKGLVMQEQIADEYESIQAFLCCYDPLKEVNQATNNHKLMEYLSSGKVVISHFVETYASRNDLVEMVKTYDNTELPKLFKRVIFDIGHYNRKELQIRRIQFALDNTYSKQVDRIEEKFGN